MKAAALGLILLVATPAAAQDEGTRHEARRLAGEGLDLARAGDLAPALERLRRADALVPAPTLKVEIARLLDRMDRMAEAAESYRAAITSEIPKNAPEVHKHARQEAIDELATLLEARPRLVVRTAAAWSVTVDGVAVEPGEPVVVDPGLRVVVVERDGRRLERRREVKRGERAVVRVEPPPPAVPGPPPASRVPLPSSAGPDSWAIAGFTGLGLAGAGLVTWGIAGGIAIDRRSQLDDRCIDGRCQPGTESEIGRYDTARRVSTVGFVVGAAATALAVPFLIVGATNDHEVAVDGRGLWWRGRF